MIGDHIRRSLPQLRMQAESLMTEQCLIERQTGTAYNADLHTDKPVWQTVYTGKCRIRPVSGVPAASLAELFGQEINSLAQLGTLPIDVTNVRADDRLTITAADTDPGQVGCQYTIQAVSTGALAVARRFVAVENQG